MTRCNEYSVNSPEISPLRGLMKTGLHVYTVYTFGGLMALRYIPEDVDKYVDKNGYGDSFGEKLMSILAGAGMLKYKPICRIKYPLGDMEVGERKVFEYEHSIARYPFESARRSIYSQADRKGWAVKIEKLHDILRVTRTK